MHPPCTLRCGDGTVVCGAGAYTGLWGLGAECLLSHRTPKFQARLPEHLTVCGGGRNGGQAEGSRWDPPVGLLHVMLMHTWALGSAGSVFQAHL